MCMYVETCGLLLKYRYCELGLTFWLSVCRSKSPDKRVLICFHFSMCVHLRYQLQRRIWTE